MRIHSDILTSGHIYQAVALLPGVYVDISSHGSRSRAAAFEVSLEGNGYQKNTGQHGAGVEYAATWDEWGAFLGYLFTFDPDMLCGSAKRPTYADAEDFHQLTGDRFRSLEIPADTHKRHRWDPTDHRHYSCHTCSATMRIRS